MSHFTCAKFNAYEKNLLLSLIASDFLFELGLSIFRWKKNFKLKQLWIMNHPYAKSAISEQENGKETNTNKNN